MAATTFPADLTILNFLGRGDVSIVLQRLLLIFRAKMMRHDYLPVTKRWEKIFPLRAKNPDKIASSALCVLA